MDKLAFNIRYGLQITRDDFRKYSAFKTFLKALGETNRFCLNHSTAVALDTSDTWSNGYFHITFNRKDFTSTAWEDIAMFFYSTADEIHTFASIGDIC